LFDDGSTLARHRPERFLVDRDVAPAEQLLPCGEHLVLDDLLAAAPLLGVAWKEHAPRPIFAARRDLYAAFLPLLDEELVRQLQENAGTVSGKRVAAAGTAVDEVEKDLDPLSHD